MRLSRTCTTEVSMVGIVYIVQYPDASCLDPSAINFSTVSSSCASCSRGAVGSPRCSSQWSGEERRASGVVRRVLEECGSCLAFFWIWVGCVGICWEVASDGCRYAELPLSPVSASVVLLLLLLLPVSASVVECDRSRPARSQLQAMRPQ
jgi:hypothetical protein